MCKKEKEYFFGRILPWWNVFNYFFTEIDSCCHLFILFFLNLIYYTELLKIYDEGSF